MGLGACSYLSIRKRAIVENTSKEIILNSINKQDNYALIHVAIFFKAEHGNSKYAKPYVHVTKYLDPRNVRTTPVQIFGPPLKYLGRMRSACCSRVVNCTENGRPRFVSSWDDTLLTRCHESGL